MMNAFFLIALVLAVLLGGILIDAYQNMRAWEEWYKENKEWLEEVDDVR